MIFMIWLFVVMGMIIFGLLMDRWMKPEGKHLGIEGERVVKPWGYEIIWAKTDRYVGKILFIKAGHKLSKQYHKVKDESIMILKGEMILEREFPSMQLSVDEKVLVGQNNLRPMGVGEVTRIRPGVVHRMIAVTDVEVMEVSTPELSDVVRLEDSYGRVG